MRRKTLYGYYAFGYNYQLLRDDGTLGDSPAEAKRRIEYFLRSLDDLELQVTKKIAEDLLPISEEIAKAQQNVGNEIADSIKEIIERLDPSLDAELKIKTAYILVKKNYPLETLLDNSLDLLSKASVESLTVNSKLDFTLATRQIALSQGTAAAFHLMRALEEQVKCLYFAFKKTKRLKTPMWGPMLRELKDKRPPKPSEKLLNHLDGMRVHFRNPTQHPDAFYKIDEAQDLLNSTITAINMISSELPAPKAK